MKQIVAILLLVFIMIILPTEIIVGQQSYGYELFDRDYELFNRHGAAMLLIDAQTGKIDFANQAAVDFYGYSKEELLTMNIQEINALSPKEVENERHLAAEEERNFFEFTHKLADGDKKEVEVYSYPIIEDERELLFSIVHDVSAQAETLRSLRI